MSLWELFVIAVGLSMDAFAVAICKGLSVGRVRGSHAVTAGIYFGGFQMLMPLLGYLLGVRFQEIIAGVDHWIAFLPAGADRSEHGRPGVRGGEEHVDSSFRPRSMLPLAVATSIDALAVGVTFAFLRVEIGPAVSCIGVITFLLCGGRACEYRLGAFGDRHSRAKRSLPAG